MEHSCSADVEKILAACDTRGLPYNLRTNGELILYDPQKLATEKLKAAIRANAGAIKQHVAALKAEGAPDCALCKGVVRDRVKIIWCQVGQAQHIYHHRCEPALPAWLKEVIPMWTTRHAELLLWSDGTCWHCGAVEAEEDRTTLMPACERCVARLTPAVAGEPG